MTKLEQLLEWMDDAEYAPSYGELRKKVKELIAEEQQVKSVDLADVVLPKGKLCDHKFKDLKFIRDRQIVCKCGDRFSY